MTQPLETKADNNLNFLLHILHRYISFPLKWWLISLVTTVTSLYSAALFRGVRIAELSYWDADFYKRIVKYGYLSELPMENGKIATNVNAFFPVFPLTVKAIDAILPGGSSVAFLFVNLTASLATLIVFYQCAKLLLEDKKARQATVLFAVFPSSFIFFWFYSESISALLLVIGLYLMLKNKLIISSLVFGVAAATRPNAIFLCIAPAVFIAANFLRNNRIVFTFDYIKNLFIAAIKSLVLALISVSGFYIFLQYLDNKTGIDKVWFKIQREAWGQKTTPFSGLKIYYDFLSDYNSLVKIAIIACVISFCSIIAYLIFSNKEPNNKLLFSIPVFLAISIVGMVILVDQSTSRLIIIVFSGLVYFVVTCIVIRQIHIDKYSPLSLALYVPVLLLIFIALSNGSSIVSLRFIVTGTPIFIALATFLPSKSMKYIVPLSIVSMFALCFFHAWGLHEPFMVASP